MNSTPSTPQTSQSTSHVPAFAWIVLAALGCIDLLRGFMHTFVVEYSAINIAGLNLKHAAQDQLMLLGVFGISNWLTGVLFLAIAFKARPLVPTVLAIIPLTYLWGILALRMNVTPEAEFRGRTFMFLYLGISAITFIACMISMRRNRHP